MLKINSMKQVALFALIMFSALLFSTTVDAAKTTHTGVSQEWAAIDGFRSAKFGSNESAVLRAIKKDFRVNKKSVSRGVNSNEKTVFLMIDVKDLLAESGPSKVIYIFGYKSKKLIQVKVVWGKLAQKKPNIETIVSIATQLSNYLRQKRYQKNGFASYR